MDLSHTITKEEVYEFLNTIHLAVFGTTSPENSPHLVTMIYVVDKNLNFYFITRSETGKVANIKNNPSVSVVVSDRDSYKTVEANGVAIPLTDTDKIREVIKMFGNIYRKQDSIKEDTRFNWPPPLEKIEQGEIIIYQVTPDYLRFADYSHSSPLDGRFIQEIIPQ